MTGLLLATAELIEEVKYLLASLFFFVFYVQTNEGSLHEWHDFPEHLLLFLLDGVLVQGVSRVHKLCLLILILPQLTQVPLIEVVEQVPDGFLRLLQLLLGVSL